MKFKDIKPNHSFQILDSGNQRVLFEGTGQQCAAWLFEYYYNCGDITAIFESPTKFELPEHLKQFHAFSRAVNSETLFRLRMDMPIFRYQMFLR